MTSRLQAARTVAWVDNFQRRVLQDALAQASRDYWLRRAQTFLDARPRVNDFRGQATRADLRLRWDELTAIGDACRHRAALCEADDSADELDQVIEELSA